MDKFIIRKDFNGNVIVSDTLEVENNYHNDTDDDDDDEDVIRVYTDGACIDNGKPYARAGYGIWFGENDSRNVSESYNGKQTNNIAELLAIIKALTILNNDINNGKNVIVYSDSRYAIRCCEEYGEKCFKNNWINPNSKNKPIPNLELVQTAYMYCRNYKNIKFTHVRSHTGKKDRDSIGNDHADRLANLAIGISTKKRDTKKNKIYLNIPFSEKDEAKKMGARWDSSKKKWYIDDKNKYKNQFLARWGTDTY